MDNHFPKNYIMHRQEPYEVNQLTMLYGSQYDVKPWVPPYVYNNPPMKYTNNIEVNQTPVKVKTSKPRKRKPKNIVLNEFGELEVKEPARKGRKRKFEHTREERKQRKYSNHSYINSRNKEVLAKEFKDFDCKCTLNCQQNIPVADRLKEFQAFHALGTYSARNLYILERVDEIPKKRTFVKSESPDPKHQREFSRKYHINKVQVCKAMFLKSLCVSPTQISTVLKKARRGEGLMDKRGMNTGGYNKMPKSQLAEIINHISQHYTNPLYAGYHSIFNEPNERKTLQSVYGYYKKEKGSEPCVSLSTYKSIYYKYFKSKHSIKEPKNDNEDYKCISKAPEMTSPMQYVSVEENKHPIAEPHFADMDNVEDDDYYHASHPEVTINTPHTFVGLNPAQISNVIKSANQLVQVTMIENLPQKITTTADNSGKPKKGRKFKYAHQTRQERKDNKYNNLRYFNTKNEEVSPKVFEDFICPCSSKCTEKLPLESRKRLFEKFHNMGSYSAQNLFILERVEEVHKKRCYRKNEIPRNERTFSRMYTLEDHKVCKIMFLKTLKISANRISTVLRKARDGKGLLDERGYATGGRNKLPDEVRIDAMAHLTGVMKTIFPEFKEGGRVKIPLPRPHKFTKIYEQYAQSRLAGTKPASFSVYKLIFYKEFAERH